jgi:ABC-type branched-subunit amino acid transport system ATPase component
VVLNRGKIIAEGAPGAIARDPVVVKAYFGEEMTLA